MKKLLIAIALIVTIIVIYFITKPADQKSYSIIKTKYENKFKKVFSVIIYDNVSMGFSSDECIRYCF